MSKTKQNTKKVAVATTISSVIRKRPPGRPRIRVITPVHNLDDLRVNLMQLYNDVQAGNVDHNTARTIGNLSGKIISCINTELKLRKFNNEKTKIDL